MKDNHHATSTVIGGPIGDRIGRKKVIGVWGDAVMGWHPG